MSKQPGTLRVSYKGRKTVFEYKLDRSEVDEMLRTHARHWAAESIRSADNPAEMVVAPIDQSAMIIEWVTGLGSAAEKVTPVPNPFGG